MRKKFLLGWCWVSGLVSVATKEEKVDIVIDIVFIPEDPGRSIIRTNAKKEAIEDILVNWIRGQIGTYADKSKPNIKEEYKIKIGLTLSDDSFCTESDTGNKSVTCGIIMELLNCLHELKILPLQEG